MGKSLIPKSKAKTAYGLLSEVAALILAEPKRYFQGRFIARRGGINDADKETMNGFPDCGTVGCVAGWVATLKHGDKFTYGNTQRIAAQVLGFDAWGNPARELFSAGALDYKANGTPRVLPNPQTAGYAILGAAHIRRFQKKYRTQLLAKKV